MTGNDIICTFSDYEKLLRSLIQEFAGVPDRFVKAKIDYLLILSEAITPEQAKSMYCNARMQLFQDGGKNFVSYTKKF